VYLRAVITCNYYLSGDTGGIPLNREGIYIEALMKPSHYSIYRWCVYEKYLRDLRFIQSSTRSKVGPITLDVKCAGARSAGNPHAACDEEGAGDRPMVWRLRHSQRKRGETDGPNLQVLRQPSTLPPALSARGRWSLQFRATKTGTAVV
jgi:hypothetical protein